MLKLKDTHREWSPELKLLPVGLAVPCQVSRAALHLRVYHSASLIPVCYLERAVYSSVMGSSLTSERSIRTAIHIPRRDVHYGLMKTQHPHHNSV